jgi:hypothetical protein
MRIVLPLFISDFACRWGEGNPLLISISIKKTERKVIVMKELMRITWLVDE